MKKAKILLILLMAVTFSSFAYSDGISVYQTYKGSSYKQKIYSSATYNYVTYHLHIQGTGPGCLAWAKIQLDYGVVGYLWDHGFINLFRSASNHNEGSDIILEVYASKGFDDNYGTALSEASVSW